jgi:hypothetical protein
MTAGPDSGNVNFCAHCSLFSARSELITLGDDQPKIRKAKYHDCSDQKADDAEQHRWVIDRFSEPRR